MKNFFLKQGLPNLLYLLTAGILISCNNNNDQSDAYGNFEGTEITISAETTGKISFLKIYEGEDLNMGRLVGLIDTSSLYLRKKQLLAQADIIRARRPSITAQIDVLREQKENAQHELDRFKKLAEQGAATEKQVDDIRNQISVFEKQIRQIETQNQPIVTELRNVEVQIEQIRKQIEDAQIKVPINGKVLLKLKEAHEFVTPGMPLFKMADLDTLILRAYINGGQLDEVKSGDEVTVLIDDTKKEYHRKKGVITWIADQAEFTPTGIKTKDERVDLVYAIKIAVANPDGMLKIGMPGEVLFKYSEGE